MAIVETNIETLALKGILIGSKLTLKDGTVIEVIDFEKDMTTNTYKIKALNNEVYPVQSSYIGEVEHDQIVDIGLNTKKRTKLKRK